MRLPETLSRKAIIVTFDRLEPVVWEKLFEREDSNGIVRHRVPGEDYQRKVYYRTEGIMAWLVREGCYTLEDYATTPRLGGEAPERTLPAPRRIAMSA
jgi:hypothetical protein